MRRFEISLMTPNFMVRPRTRWWCVVLAMVVPATLGAPAALAQADQRRLVTSATVTLASFLDDPDMTWLRQNIGRARAVMIAPEITKASFIVGGSGGRAVVVVRDPSNGHWAGPAFYTVATASLGLQAGVAVSEVVTLVMTEKGVGRLLSDSFRIERWAGSDRPPMAALGEVQMLGPPRDA